MLAVRLKDQEGRSARHRTLFDNELVLAYLGGSFGHFASLGIVGLFPSCSSNAWPSVPVVQWSGSLLLNKSSELPSRATSLPDFRNRTMYVAGQHALSDCMSCFACVKSLRDAICSISPFSNFFRTTYTAHLYVGDFEQNTAPLKSYSRTMLRC